MLNCIILIGRLTKDPKQINSGENAVVVFDIAIDNPRQTIPKSEERGTSFFSCKSFGKVAESIAKNLHKGSQIAIKGQIQQREYLAKDGSKRKDYEVYADAVQFLDKKDTPEAVEASQGESEVEKRPEEVAPKAKFDPFTGKPLNPEEVK